ncbi:MAG TPA: efflux RND transporter periplasmic adaptor subunit [Burkholderiales bacterium]|nr:efflux RND transporter periplasmic adaptor subunit [Burkholderiales bacterium]
MKPTLSPMLPAVILLAMLTGCGQPAAEVPSNEPRIDGESVVFPHGSDATEKLASMTLSQVPVPAFRLNGRLTWNEDRTVRIFTPFAGRVARILVQPGDRVKKGQALAVIASPDFGQAQADARRAESDYALAGKNLARLQELEQHGVAPLKDLQSAEADQARAQAELSRTRERLRLYGSRASGVDQTYTLTSPVAGTVVEKNINPGQELRPDQMIANAPALFVVTDPESLWVQLDATERDLAEIKLGQRISIRSPVYHDEDFTAQVDAVSDFLDPATRTIKVRASLNNSHHRLKAEMFVTAELRGSKTLQLQVPAKSVFFQGDKYYLFVDNGSGKYTRRQVTIGDEQQGAVEIRDGVAAGDKIVTDGALMLQQILQPRRIQK